MIYEMMIYQICESQWVLVHETNCIFDIFWTTTHEVKLAQLIDVSKGNNFQ